MSKQVRYVAIPQYKQSRYFVNELGEIFVVRKLKPQTTRRGYQVVALYEDGIKKPKWKSVHLIVAESFIGPKLTGMTVNHKNFQTADNRVENLEYMTLQENIKHSWANGRRKAHPALKTYGIGRKPPNRKFTDEQALEIIAAYTKGIVKHSMDAIGKRFGISASSVHRIVHGTIVYKSISR